MIQYIFKNKNVNRNLWLLNTTRKVYGTSNNSISHALLKHKDSFGKSENLPKIFFAEILVFDHDYEGKSSSSNGLL